MRELWENKKARKFLALDLVCAIPLAAITAPWWLRVLAVAYGILFLLITFGTGYFTGQTVVYGRTIDEMTEMRETVAKIAATHETNLASLREFREQAALIPPPRHYH